MKDIVKSDQKQEEIKIINGEEVVVSRKKRRRNFSLYYLLITIFVILAMIALSFTFLFRIDTINVKGNTLYTTDQVIEVSGISIGDNLFRTNTSEVESKILSAFPYFESASVSRKLASTVNIELVEATPAVSIKYSDTEFMVVSTKGKILETGLTSPKEGTAEVYGMEMTQTAVGMDYSDADGMKKMILDEIISQSQKIGLDKITQIDVTSRTDIRLVYNGTVKVKLGSSQDISFKLSYIKSVIERVGENYSGMLVYHSAESGISAIPDETEPVTEAPAESETDISGEESQEPQEEENWEDYVR